MSEKRTKIRLADVACEAEVSTATVSRFMSGRADVTPEKRERIVQAAKRLGFNLGAGKKSRIIAFVLSNRDELHPFHSSVLVGAETYCAEYEYSLLFLPLRYSMNAGAGDLELPEILQSKQTVAGVIVAGANSQGLLDALTQLRMPWVALGNNVVGDSEKTIPGAVYFDDLNGAYDLTRYLQSLGHRNIAFIGDLRLPWYARRFEGYRRAMNDAGLDVLSKDLNPCPEEEMGYLATKLFFQQTPALTAIFAGDDSVAGGVYKAVRDSGLTIPRDISVAGFNDTREASFLHPPLTSVRVFTNELGRQLAESLLKNIGQTNKATGIIVHPTQLVRRESCAVIAPDPALPKSRATKAASEPVQDTPIGV